MADTIKLKHQYRSTLPLKVQHFYDGRAEVRMGVIELPVDKPAWIERSFMIGYRLDPETNKPLSLGEIRRLASPVDPESTESAGENNEGSDLGGQPDSPDGVREGEPEGGEGVLESGLGSGSGGGATDSGDAQGDESADQDAGSGEAGPDGPVSHSASA